MKLDSQEFGAGLRGWGWKEREWLELYCLIQYPLATQGYEHLNVSRPNWDVLLVKFTLRDSKMYCEQARNTTRVTSNIYYMLKFYVGYIGLNKILSKLVFLSFLLWKSFIEKFRWHTCGLHYKYLFIDYILLIYRNLLDRIRLDQMTLSLKPPQLVDSISSLALTFVFSISTAGQEY